MSAEERMKKYLESTKYATEELIRIINNEEKELEELIRTLKENEALANKLDQEMHQIKGLDDITFLRDQATYHFIEGAKIENQLKKNTERFKDKYESLSTLSGALLQIAKQGISISYHGTNNPFTECKNGKTMKSQFLKTVIWEGRNQSLHYEEGFNDRFQKTKDCFIQLNRDYEIKIDRNGDDKINLAKEVISIIGWKDYEDYYRDMLSLV
ncbi:hypothetical protein DN392_22730 [Bacillus sp. BB51/4]|uniref:hypothetical protein n=1 Tax=Bacillus cereus group TaxID=86661 RepID=UPI000B4B1EB0|nr:MULTISPECIES: hypothetical protein [Bacillus cereus group]KAA0770783.1 hypothetical protein DN392_22730 [Bacillus sp. BB51/4]